MPVIAITWELGALGTDVALGVAEELRLRIVDPEVLEHVADRMHTGKSIVGRFVEGRAGLLERWRVDRSAISLYTAQEIVELAERGNALIHSWGAACLLRPIRHVASVRIWAPIDFRVRVQMERLETSDDAFARRAIHRSDAAHARVMHRLFRVENWQDPALYDLALDTSRVPVAACVDQIKRLVQSPEFHETPDSRARLLALKLELRIRAALKECGRRPGAYRGVGLAIDRESGRVTLRGGVYSEEDRHAVEDLVAGVPGVSEVANELRVIKLDG
jgi:cytidylate kinase